MNKIDELFLSFLKDAFKAVINSPDSLSVDEIRSLSSKKIQKAFSKVKYEIHGSENLPSKGNLIFIEPLGTNPIINLYRKLTPKSRSKDEHPLINKDFK